MTDTEIIAQAKNLPAIPRVIASTMLHAQGYTPTAEEHAAIRARADFFERIDIPRSVMIPVYDFHGAHIGHITYNA